MHCNSVNDPPQRHNFFAGMRCSEPNGKMLRGTCAWPRCALQQRVIKLESCSYLHLQIFDTNSVDTNPLKEILTKIKLIWLAVELHMMWVCYCCAKAFNAHALVLSGWIDPESNSSNECRLIMLLVYLSVWNSAFNWFAWYGYLPWMPLTQFGVWRW